MENAVDKENVFLPVTAMVLGIVATIACFDSSPLDVEASLGSGAALTIVLQSRRETAAWQ